MKSVYTETTCDTCKMVLRETNDGSGHCPPVGWAEVTVSRRLNGAGWTQSTRLFHGYLCPECQERALAVLRNELP